MELRVTAAPDPVALGTSFEATLRDTWSRTGEPEDQVVRWRFTSPTGVAREVDAEYRGDYRWAVDFQPEELGPWRYEWRHTFTDQPYASPPGRFDVVATEREAVLDFVDRLEKSVSEARLAGSFEPPDLHRWRIRFSRLQRAALRFEDPDSFRGESGRELLLRLDRVRTALSGKEVPVEIPFISHPPPRPEVGGWTRWRVRMAKAMRRRVSRLTRWVRA
jgi:hypothetical protein